MMRKSNVLVAIIMLIFLVSCKKTENIPSRSEKLQFQELRKFEHLSSLKVWDDSLSEKTEMSFNGKIIFSTAWHHGIYGGPIMPPRFLWAKSESNYEFILVGPDDLFYDTLIIIKPFTEPRSEHLGIITLLDSELRKEKTVLWLKYNNSWIRSGRIADKETEISL